MNPAEGCLRRPTRDIVDARTGVWHAHIYTRTRASARNIYVGVHVDRLPAPTACMYLHIRTCTCALRPGGETSREAGALPTPCTRTYTYPYTRRVCAAAGARRPSSPVPPVCARVSPRNFQLPNNKVPGWPNYCRVRRAALAADRYFVSRINKATPRLAGWRAGLLPVHCDFVPGFPPFEHAEDVSRIGSWKSRRVRGDHVDD